MSAFARVALRHALGFSTPGDAGAAFMRLAGTFILLGLALGVAFAAFGWSVNDPIPHPGRLGVGGALAALGLAGVWFIEGVVASVARRAARVRRAGGAVERAWGRDNLVVMTVMAALAVGWAGRGVVMLSRGAPITEALAWRNVTPWGTVRLAGDAVIARGAIGPAFASDIRDALESRAGVRELRIDSGGGLVASGDAIAAVVRAHGVDVVVGEYCASACLPIFLAGRRRVLAPGAALGCHQMSDGLTGAPAGAARNFRDIHPPDDAAPVHARLIAACDATPPRRMYEPSLRDLAAIGAVTHLGAEAEDATPIDVFCAQHPLAC